MSTVNKQFPPSQTAAGNSPEARGERLARVRGNEAQATFAPKIGAHKNTLGHWERGRTDVAAAALATLVEMGWNGNWLLTGEGPERLDAVKQGVSATPGMQPEMMQRAVESAVGVFQRFNRLPSAEQLARASVLLYLLFTDTQPDPTAPVDELLARIVSEPADQGA